MTYFIFWQRIEILKAKISFLEYHKIAGTRDIDSLQVEIDEINKEIIQLNRKYFNWFYYF
jgi:hypothetical protein